MTAIAKSGTATPASGSVAAWIALLGLAQLADLVTTQASMARGGVEANWVAAGLLALGGLALLGAVKLGLVVAMGAAAVLIARHRAADSSLASDLADRIVWRGIQACVVVLAVTAVHNVAILGQLSG